MIALVDYYALLGIPRTATAADIQKAYKLQLRIWRKRAARSMEGSIRDEAQRRLALLAEAYQVLSDPQRRATYDRQPRPGALEPATTPDPAAMPVGDSIEQAELYLAQGDYSAAAHAAREATATHGTSAESWSALARANAGLRRLDDAIYEARRAIELAPDTPLYHAELGAIYEELGRWDEALREYQQAAERDPQDLAYQLAIGGVWLQRGEAAKALPIIERVYATLPDDETVCYYYAQALIAMADAVPNDKSEEGYAVTSAHEIERMREFLTRAAAVRHLDPESRQAIRDIETYLQRMEGHAFHVPFTALSAFSAIGGLYSTEGGCSTEAVTLLLAGTLIGLIAFAPLWLVIWGISALSSGEAGGLLLLMIGGGLGYLWYRSLWVPRWKVNARKRTQRIRYAG